MTRRNITSDRWAPAWKAGLILLLTVLAYSPVFQAGFIWDDEGWLPANADARSLAGLRDIWLGVRTPDYFPLTSTSFWLEWRLWGMNPTGYHVTNLLLHGLGAVLLWRVLLRLKIPGAWFAALVFAVHPVCVASVAWIAERKNTLSLLFFLLSILWYLRFDEPNGHRPSAIGHRKWYGLSLCAFLLALLSKTSVVMLPLILWLCVWWRRSRCAERGARSAEGTFGKFLADGRRLLPFFTLALVLGLVTVWFQSHRAISGQNFGSDPMGVRLLGGSWALWFYLGKALLPVKLSMVYPRWEINPSSVVAWLPALLWLGAMMGCWRFRRTWGAAGLFGLGSFFLLLLPVLGFFDMYFFVYSPVADHLQYLALIGVVALAVGGVCAKVKIQSSRVLLATPVLVLLFALTWRQARVYANEETLWRDTVAKNPESWVAHNNLGAVLTNPGDKQDCYRAALQLKPDYALAHNNLGAALLEQGKVEEAVSQLNEAIKFYPGLAAAYNNLGKALLRQGQPEKAREQFETSLRHDPNQADAELNLGGVLFNLGRYADAVAHYKAALRIKPVYPAAHFNLGMALAAMGRTKEAADEFTTALRFNPNSAPAHFHLGMVLAREKKTGEAIMHLREAVRLKRDSVEALNNLAWILATHPEAQYRNGNEAVKLAERAAGLTQQKDAAALDTLAAAYAEAGRFADAERTARQAEGIAADAGQKELAAQIGARLKSYQAGQPWREP